MTTHYERHIRLAGAHNVRDLGGYATAAAGTTRWRSLLRADALHELTADDIGTLLALGLRTVIDLRSAVEISRQPSVFAGRGDVRYHHVPIFDGLAPADAMLRDRGIADLSERYIEAAEACRPALIRVAATIAEAEDGAVLFNCTAGKDRTGIVAAMLLSIAGVPDEEIAADYALTADVAPALMQRLKAAAIARGLEERLATRLLSSERAAMMALLRHVEERHSGFRNYLLAVRPDHDWLARIESRLLGPDAMPARHAAVTGAS